MIVDFLVFVTYLLIKLNYLTMKKLFFATMITLSMVMVSCGGNNTEATTELTDSTSVDSTLVDTTSVSVDTVSVDTAN